MEDPIGVPMRIIMHPFDSTILLLAHVSMETLGSKWDRTGRGISFRIRVSSSIAHVACRGGDAVRGGSTLELSRLLYHGFVSILCHCRGIDDLDDSTDILLFITGRGRE